MSRDTATGPVRIPSLQEAGVASLRANPLAEEALARAKIAYTDIDGTLLGRGGCLLCDLEGRPSLAAAEAVTALNRAGKKVVIASGRTVPMLKEISRMLGWKEFIAEMGCVRGQAIGGEPEYWLGEWDPAVLDGRTPYQVIAETGAIDALFNEFPGKIEYHSPHHKGRDATHLLRGRVDAEAAQSLLDSMPSATETPLTFLDNGVINPPSTGLRDVSDVHAYHVMPRGVSKAGAILEDLRRRGIDPSDAVMVGDSAADMAVHDSLGLVVMVANALRSPFVRQEAPNADNVVFTEGASGSGWAEFASAWLSAS
ncbi:MAG: hypothetical protein Kow0056_12620 [Coriobacteriia bacterium]